jgi:hypothetical protein
VIHVHNIEAWKAKGLSQRIKEVEVFLSVQNTDILLVLETRFAERNYVKIPAYTTYVTNHPDERAHSSSDIIIRSNIKLQELATHKVDRS